MRKRQKRNRISVELNDDYMKMLNLIKTINKNNGKIETINGICRKFIEDEIRFFHPFIETHLLNGTEIEYRNNQLYISKKSRILNQ